ncbi:recombinase family protein [Streptomyces iakyrus]|uniref:Recombinase family protein n=1 Tax=Streptomyces iakyrus TaxID=68219 RepID=A0ABW8FP86_9ACTN
MKDAHGVEDQHRDMTETARRFGWLVVYRYTDNDKSASKENIVRDDFEQLLADLAAGTTPDGYPIHGVMAVNDDRLYRRPSDWERYLKAFTTQEDASTTTRTASRTCTPKASRSKGSWGSPCPSARRGRRSAGAGTATAAGRSVGSP